MAAELDVLLIEDNPGDARLIEEMFRDAGELLQRVEVGSSRTEGTQLVHEESLESGLDRLSETDVDVVLLDLGLPESRGLDTLATVVEATEFVPVVVLTGLSDEEVGIEAVQRGAQDYLVKGEVTGDLLVRSIRHAVERERQERERARQLDQLEALNRLNRVSQDVTHAVITSSTREGLERAVCDRLVESDAYRFAWIGDVERSSGRITPRVTAGVEDGYLDDVTITADDGETAEGPAGRAVRTREVQVVRDTESDPSFEPWRDNARERGYRSSAAVPVAHEDVLYGVVCLYAASPNAFTEPEVEVLSRLGDVIGHAITAIERREALVSDAALELEFRAEGFARELVALTAERDCAIDVRELVRGGDGLVGYGRATGVPPDDLREAAERTTAVDEFRVLAGDGEDAEFELVTSAADSLVTAVGTHGGHLASAAVADGEFRFVVEFPTGRDKHRLVDLVESHCDGAVPRAQRTVERDELDAAASRSVFRNRLTEKQRTALEVAFHAGYFDWPRSSTGEEVADRLGVSPATFTQHLRVAERKFFEAVFGDAREDPGAASSWTPLRSESGDG